MDRSMETYIGKQLVTNLFNDKGVFVLPALTILNADHIRLISQHRINLESHDVVHLNSAAHFQLAIDDCTVTIENIFKQKIGRAHV